MSRSLKGYSVSSDSSILPLSAPPTSAQTGAGAETPYDAASKSGLFKSNSISSKYSLGADPLTWGSNLNPRYQEADDELHNPTVRGGRLVDETELVCSTRGFANLGCLFILCLGLLALFVGYPAFTFGQRIINGDLTANALGVNATGQVPVMPGGFSPIDPETPQEARTRTSIADGSQWQLVFSDEFNTDGRTFYPGEDPYWEAVDLWYWETSDLEYYDPAQVTTKNGSLAITMIQKENRGLNFQSGMLSSWNKFCFTGGYIEVAVQLPGASNVVGLWPAIWTMGNLGRAGYGASLEGMWPYTYDACDVGTAPNQTINGLPESSTTSGLEDSNFELSFLPGQRLSRCTCPGESHPGPMHSDGTFVGRSAPEIDIFESQVTGSPLSGQVSQSSQWGPFNTGYVWDNSSDNLIISDSDVSSFNTFIGNKFQETTSVITETNSDCYQLGAGCFAVYGFEYKPGFDDGYIQWVANAKPAWRINAAGMGADTSAEISERAVSQEPMYILMNLGLSFAFAANLDIELLTFPAVMLIDYVRVYQDPNNINVGCDPVDFPTQSYINTYAEAYNNANLTTWRDDFGQPFPKNKLTTGCD